MKVNDPIRFRVWCEGPKSRQICVTVWPTRKQLREATMEWGAKRTVVAAFLPFEAMEILDKDGALKRTRLIGEMHFCRRMLGTETIVHECAHAAAHWDKHTKNDDEERFCDVVGKLAARTVRGMREAGIDL